MNRSDLLGPWGEAAAAEYLRKNADFAQAREFVTAEKQRRIRATAGLYLNWNPSKRQPRFDVIEIYAPEGTQTQNPVINHLEDAFQ